MLRINPEMPQVLCAGTPARPPMDRDALLVGAGLVAALLASYLLPVGLYASALLVLAALLSGAVALVPGVWPSLYRATGVGPGAWALAAAVAVGGIACSYLVGDPQPFCDGVVYRGCLTLYGWSSAVFLASTFGVAIGVGHLGRYRRLRRASAVPAGEVSEGAVAVEGRVVPADGTVTGPVSDAEAVWYRRAVETPTAFGAHRETDSGTGGGTFYVRDGSGRLLVLPDRLDSHDVAELARSHTAEDGDDRRREWRYEPDDAVTVVGRASEVSRAAYPEPVVVGLDAPVVVGRGTLDDLRAWAARRALVGCGLALVVGGGSLAVLLLAA